MLHGGLAVNAVLPKSKKFYDETTVPDYDAMIPDNTGKITKKIMFEAQGKLTKAEYTAHFHPAIHGNTHKSRSHPKGSRASRRSATPTYSTRPPSPRRISRPLRPSPKRRKSSARPNSRASLVPTAWMKLSMHLEFSRPSVHIGRWSKLFPRCVRLYETFPTVLLSAKSKFQAGAHDTTAAKLLLENVGDDAFLVGEYAALKIMGRPEGGRPAVVVKDLPGARPPLRRQARPRRNRSRVHVPPRTLSGRGPTVYSWEECSAVVEDGLFGNSDTVLRYLYGEFIQYGTASVIDDLVKFQLAQTADDISKGMGTRFSTVCK